MRSVTLSRHCYIETIYVTFDLILELLFFPLGLTLDPGIVDESGSRQFVAVVLARELLLQVKKSRQKARFCEPQKVGSRMANDPMAHSMVSSYFPCNARAALRRALLISATVGLCWAMPDAAQAGEKLAALECSNFCQPMNTHQLATSRAEGASNARSGASTQLSVILWDENRRLIPPRGSSGTVTSPTTTPLTITPPTSGSAPVPVLVH